MKKRKVLLYASVVCLVLSAAMDSAWAYFTTYTTAAGGYPIHLGDETKIEEDFSAWTKHVKITSREDSMPVYVRARAFCGSEYELVYGGSSKWSPGGDGYYYYSDILYGGETTEELEVKIGGIPESAQDKDSFNVVVIYETTPVLYRDDGSPYADWEARVVAESAPEDGGAAGKDARA